MATEVLSALSTTDRTGQAAPGGGTFDFSYTSMDAFRVAIEARGKNLVARDVQETLWCYPDWPGGHTSSFVSTSGWTTDATRFLRILGVESTGGLLGQGFYIKNDLFRGVIRPFQAYFRIADVGIENTYTSPGGWALGFDDNQFCQVDRCIVKAARTASLLDCRNSQLRNSIFITLDDSSMCIDVNSTSGMTFTAVENCTLIGGNYNIDAQGAVGTYRNVFCYEFGLASVNRFVDDSLARNNIAADGVLSGSLAIVPTDADFVDTTNEDYHLSATSQAKDVGYDNTARGYTDDIDGDTRPQGAEWDVGADERAEGAPPAATQNAIFHGFNF